MDIQKANVAAMTADNGYDVVIVCTNNVPMSTYWTQRLQTVKGVVVPKTCTVVAVDEDWPGGAGNGLGTLYAWQKAVAAKPDGRDIAAELAEGKISVALFHTAGKGTRLAPLPGAENNNKPGVKIPASITLSNGDKVPVSILESVILQTGVYAASRKGRLSVYWGDQVFIPACKAEYTPTHHADILCACRDMPSAEEWVAEGLDKYGLICVNGDGNAAQVEKVDHATAQDLLKDLGTVTTVGTSLGSFSVSSILLNALVTEFASELAAKKGKLDTDPHFWMPLTLGKDGYVSLMGTKGIDSAVSSAHWDRMADFASKLDLKSGGLSGLLGAVDVGEAACWWDYGQLPLYSKNVLLFKEDSEQASLCREFYGMKDRVTDSEITATVDAASCITSSTVKSGSLKSCVLSCVNATSIEAEEAIIVNVSAKKIVAPKGCIIYNVVEDSEEGIVLKEGDVRVGVFTEDAANPYFVMNSALDIDGGKTFQTVVRDNPYSYQGVYDMNANADVSACEKLAKARRAAFVA